MTSVCPFLPRCPPAINRDACASERPGIIAAQVPYKGAHLHRRTHALDLLKLHMTALLPRFAGGGLLGKPADPQAWPHLVDADKLLRRLIGQKHLLHDFVLHTMDIAPLAHMAWPCSPAQEDIMSCTDCTAQSVCCAPPTCRESWRSMRAAFRRALSAYSRDRWRCTSRCRPMRTALVASQGQKRCEVACASGLINYEPPRALRHIADII